MVEREGLFKNAHFIPMENYTVDLKHKLPQNSLDLVSVFIGFHHCPLHLRDEFIMSLRDAMKMGGKMLLRDHDVHSQTMQHTVGLAHDVFNVGTGQDWSYNKRELRHFYSLAFIQKKLRSLGFKQVGKEIYQKGDPTKNALMLFEKM